jgi:hypothetical protein
MHCDEVMVKCPFDFGYVECTIECRRKDLDEHMDEAHEAHLFILDLLPADAIIPIVALLSAGTTAHIKFAAAVALERLARSDQNKGAIVVAGALAPLISLLSETGSLQVAAADALLALNLDDDAADIVRVRTVAPLVDVLRASSPAIRANDRVKEAVVRVLMYLAGHAMNRGGLDWNGAISALVALLTEDWLTTAIKETVIEALIRLALTDGHSISIVRAGAAAPLVALVQVGSVSATKALRKLSFRAENQIAIIQAGAVLPLLAITASTEHDARKFMAACALRSLGNGIAQMAADLLMKM